MASPPSASDVAQTLEEAHLDGLPTSKGSRGGAKGGKGKAKSKEGGPRAQNRDVLVSKALSKLLRHDAEKVGLKLDGEGFARCDEVLANPRIKSFGVSFCDLENVFLNNAKQRFSMKINPNSPYPPREDETNPTCYLIRANQGHSIALSSAALLTPITSEAGNVPATVVHGTYFAFYDAIVASGGLKPMSRNHVHFGTGVPALPDSSSKSPCKSNSNSNSNSKTQDNPPETDDIGTLLPQVVSGMRADAELLIYIDIERSLADGAAQWWISDNGVVLSEGGGNGCVETRYWKRVVGRKEDVGVLWEDGVMKAELPEAFRGRKAPAGKGPRRAAVEGKAKGRKGRKGEGGERAMEMRVTLGDQEPGGGAVDNGGDP